MSLISETLQQNNLASYSDEVTQILNSVTDAEIEKELSTPIKPFSLHRAITLLSPRAEKYLEQMAQLSYSVTRQRFGNTMALYAPLYVSNYCCNKCLYCGFNTTHEIKRTRLTIDEAIKEAYEIKKAGFTDLLLVSGEDRSYVSIDYMAELTTKLRDIFSTISIEIHTLDYDSYKKLFDAGVDGVTIYQETYDQKLYPDFHLGGPKRIYENRLQAMEDAGKAGMRQLGIGALLGLNDWRYEALCVALHAQVLISNFWRSRVSVSFPRMRPAEGVNPDWLKPVSDKNLTQAILAFRLCFSDIGLVLSTRESAQLRDNLLPLGLTRISAGSKTNPGGYGGTDSDNTDSTEQFAISDERGPAAICNMLIEKGFDPVWKDWDHTYFSGKNSPAEALI